jgi:hypothetical protein
MFNKEEYKSVINIPFAVIIASFIIIIVTTGMTDSNGLSALIGGYSGLLFGLIFIIILNYPPTSWLDMFPFIMIMGIVALFISYLSIYFDQISKGEVSSYYNSFSVLSTLFLATQIIILFSAMFSKSGEVTDNLLSQKTFSLLSLFGVINFLIVIIIGIVLRFYSTQG